MLPIEMHRYSFGLQLLSAVETFVFIVFTECFERNTTITVTQLSVQSVHVVVVKEH